MAALFNLEILIDSLEYVKACGINKIHFDAIQGNDPFLNNQHYINSTNGNFTFLDYFAATPIGGPTGTSTVTTIDDNDLDVTEVWNKGFDGSGVKIAILDDGVDLDHEDLQANMLTSYSSTGNYSNGVYQIGGDVPSNGSISDRGYYHGTFIAGIIGAVNNNNTGISGIAHGSKMMSIDCFGFNGGLELTETVAEGILLAIEEDIDIINASLSTAYDNLVKGIIEDFVRNARNGKGGIFVTVSGNDALTYNQDTKEFEDTNNIGFPGNLPTTITVGAIGTDNQKMWFSEYGNTLDLVAYGHGGVVSTLPENRYSLGSAGTSFAAPMVAAVAALILDANPKLHSKQVYHILKHTADKVYNSSLYQPYSVHNNIYKQHDTWSSEYGFGKVNANNAVELARNWDTQNVSFTEDMSLVYQSSAIRSYTNTIESRPSLFNVPAELGGGNYMPFNFGQIVYRVYVNSSGKLTVKTSNGGRSRLYATNDYQEIHASYFTNIGASIYNIGQGSYYLVSYLSNPNTMPFQTPITTDVVFDYIGGNLRVTDEVDLEASRSENLVVYPNPVGSSFKLSSTKSLGEAATISIYTLEGKEVANFEDFTLGAEFNIAELSSGLYKLVVTMTNGNTVAKSLFKK